MNKDFTFNKRWAGFDIKIWITMLLFLLGSMGLLGFKLLHSSNNIPLTLIAKGEVQHVSSYNFFVNEKINLQLSEQSDENVFWDFGDGTKRKDGSKVTYTYSKEGRVKITATVNGRKTYLHLKILPPRDSEDFVADNDAAFSIHGPDHVEAGGLINFTSNSNSTFYEWIIEEHPEYGIRNEPSVSYSIIDPGTYTVSLTIDNDREKKVSKTFKVTISEKIIQPYEDNELPAPLPVIINPQDKDKDNGNISSDKSTIENNKESTISKQEIPNEVFLQFLNKTVEKQMNASDFNEYLCDGANTKVKVNEQIMSFGELCTKLQEKKGFVGRVFKGKIKVKSVRQVRQDGCVAIVYVTL